MTKRVFKRWNWEHDHGEQPLTGDEPLRTEYAIALFDYKGRLYRVPERVKLSIDRSDDDPLAFDEFIYDYYCDNNGRVLQKRSIGRGDEGDVIVDLEYDDDRKEVIETAWNSRNGLGQTHVRKQRQNSRDSVGSN